MIGGIVGQVTHHERAQEDFRLCSVNDASGIKGPAGGFNGRVYFTLAGLRYRGNWFPRAVINTKEGLTIRRIDKFPVDEKLEVIHVTP